MARDRGTPAAQRQAAGRGRGGDRLARPHRLPEALRPAARGRRGRTRRHRQLRRRPPGAHLPAARHLPGGRGGALPEAAGAQRLLRRADARRRAHPRTARGGAREEGRLARRAGAVSRRREARRTANAAAAVPAVGRLALPRLGGDEAGHALRRRAGVLGVGAAVDAAGAHRDRPRGASVRGLVEPGDRLRSRAAVAADGAAHGRAQGGCAAGTPAQGPPRLPVRG